MISSELYAVNVLETHPRTLTITRKNASGIELVSLTGPIDSLTFDEFSQMLLSLTERPHTCVILDCRGITYMSFRALQLLLQYQKVAIRKNGRMALFGLSAKLMKSYQTTKIQGVKVFDIPLEEALAEVRMLAAVQSR